MDEPIGRSFRGDDRVRPFSDHIAELLLGGQNGGLPLSSPAHLHEGGRQNEILRFHIDFLARIDVQEIVGRYPVRGWGRAADHRDVVHVGDRGHLAEDDVARALALDSIEVRRGGCFEIGGVAPVDQDDESAHAEPGACRISRGALKPWRRCLFGNSSLPSKSGRTPRMRAIWRRGCPFRAR